MSDETRIAQEQIDRLMSEAIQKEPAPYQTVQVLMILQELCTAVRSLEDSVFPPMHPPVKSW